MADGTETVVDSGPSGGTPLIELRNVTRTFITAGGVEVHALRGITLSIHAGEFVSLMGQSGSGKSTLMNILGCLDHPTDGVYRFAGRDVGELDADALARLRRQAFGFVFQSYNLLGNATARENVEVPAIYAGVSETERAERAAALLGSLGLGDRLDHRPNQLSGGQQQRVSVARALMNGGEVILADEPTGALDSESGAEVIALLKDLASRGHTVILISHDAAIAAQADRRIEILDGMIVDDTGGNVPVTTSRPSRAFLAGTQRARAAATLADMREAIRMALFSLRANVFRTALTLLGIVIGVASVVAMLAIGEGAQREVLERFSSMGVNMLTVFAGGDRGELTETLTIEDGEAIADRIPNVQSTQPEMSGGATLRIGNRDYSTSIIATSGNLPETRNWPVAQGVFFTDADSESYTPVAVLGATALESLFSPGQDPLGTYVLIDKVPFQMIGTMTRKGSSGFGGRDQDDVVFVPLKTGGLRLFGAQSLRTLTVAVADDRFIDETEAAIRTLLTERHGLEDFHIFNSAELLENISASRRTFTILLASVALISLVVGGIGVMNIMLVTVTERTREIGIRMATGARQGDIMLQFLCEAVVVTALGGVLGIVLGVGVARLITLTGMPVVLSMSPAVLAFACAAAAGIIFGYAPARKAARLDPVEALATE